MKNIFKPLGVAVAVAAVTATYAGVTSAQVTTPNPSSLSARNLGDLAIVPYYTVRSGYATGVHIINTTEKTQVVKVRVRRGTDSMDSLDFNLVMSPFDEWTGSLAMLDNETKDIRMTTDDNTCTVPAFKPTDLEGTTFTKMIDLTDPSSLDFREDGEEGYIEIIGMGEIEVASPIGVASKHSSETGAPADCGKARENFFRVDGAQDPAYVAGDNPVKGVHSPSITAQTVGNTTAIVTNEFSHTQDDALKVSWLITDGPGGLEVGGNATHIEAFMQVPSMSNQQSIIFGEQDALGYLFPDLDGGSPFGLDADVGGLADDRGRYDAVDGVRAILGASSISNDWSARDTGGVTVNTDWVITLPGQYLMVDPLAYLLALENEKEGGSALSACINNVGSIDCNRRDLPAKIDITYYDREEAIFRPDDDGLVVSPSFGETPGDDALPYEVNLIEWITVGKDDHVPVFDSELTLQFEPEFDGDRGWSTVDLTASASKTQAVWYYGDDPNDPGSFTDITVNTEVPAIGFVAWERNFKEKPLANYGRAVTHSYGS